MIKKILITFIFCAVIIFVFDYYVMSYQSQNNYEIDFVIHPGDNLIKVGDNLSKRGIIDYNILFYYYSWKNKLRGKIVYGHYIIPSHAKLSEISMIFINGDAKIKNKETVDVLFREGLTLKQMSLVLKEFNLPYEEFLKLSQNPPMKIRDKFPFLVNVKSLEGYLFPATYNLYIDVSAEEILDKMLTKFNQVITNSMRDDIVSSDRTLHEVLTLASIIEREVNKSEDRAIVAGIFQNRLDIGMALGSDATIDYIKEKPEIKHTLKDLEIDSPYNTYKYAGLPPGPINSPSLEAIHVSIYPEETEYLFFLNNVTTGKTVFSKTFNEHIRKKTKNGL